MTGLPKIARIAIGAGSAVAFALAAYTAWMIGVRPVVRPPAAIPEASPAVTLSDVATQAGNDVLAPQVAPEVPRLDPPSASLEAPVRGSGVRSASAPAQAVEASPPAPDVTGTPPAQVGGGPTADAPGPQAPLAEAPAVVMPRTAPDPSIAPTVDSEVQSAQRGAFPPAVTSLAMTIDAFSLSDDGLAVLAGQADPGARVVILLDGEPVSEIESDRSGKFATLFTLAPSDTPRVMSFLQAKGGADAVLADETLIVAPFAPSVAQVVTTDPALEVASLAPQVTTRAMQADDATDASVAQLETPAELAPAAEPATPAEPVALEESAPPTEPAKLPEPVPPAEPALPMQPAAPAESAGAVETAAAPVTTPADTVAAPSSLVIGSESLRVLRRDGAVPLSIDAIGYALGDDVQIAGQIGQGMVPTETEVRLYLDNVLVATLAPDAQGRWQAGLRDVAPGLYTLRADLVSLDGAVRARAETPFLRESPEVLSSARAAVIPQPRVASTGAEAVAPVVTDGESGVESAAPTPIEPAPPTESAPTRADPPRADAPAPAQTVEILGPPPAELLEVARSTPAIRDGATSTPPAAAAQSPLSEPATTAPTDRLDARAPVVAPTAPRPGSSEALTATPAAKDRDDAPVRIVTVQPGFTLWGIASETYGSGFDYVKVFEANRSQIRNPDLIYPGQVFTLPAQDR